MQQTQENIMCKRMMRRSLCLIMAVTQRLIATFNINKRKHHYNIFSMTSRYVTYGVMHVMTKHKYNYNVVHGH